MTTTGSPTSGSTRRYRRPERSRATGTVGAVGWALLATNPEGQERTGVSSPPARLEGDLTSAEPRCPRDGRQPIAGGCLRSGWGLHLDARGPARRPGRRPTARRCPGRGQARSSRVGGRRRRTPSASGVRSPVRPRRLPSGLGRSGRRARSSTRATVAPVSTAANVERRHRAASPEPQRLDVVAAAGRRYRSQRRRLRPIGRRHRAAAELRRRHSTQIRPRDEAERHGPASASGTRSPEEQRRRARLGSACTQVARSRWPRPSAPVVRRRRPGTPDGEQREAASAYAERTRRHRPRPGGRTPARSVGAPRDGEDVAGLAAAHTDVGSSIDCAGSAARVLRPAIAGRSHAAAIRCGVQPALADELVVGAALDDRAAVEHDDLVAVADRAEPVGDDQAGAARGAGVARR